MTEPSSDAARTSTTIGVIVGADRDAIEARMIRSTRAKEHHPDCQRSRGYDALPCTCVIFETVGAARV